MNAAGALFPLSGALVVTGVSVVSAFPQMLCPVAHIFLGGSGQPISYWGRAGLLGVGLPFSFKHALVWMMGMVGASGINL